VRARNSIPRDKKHNGARRLTVPYRKSPLLLHGAVAPMLLTQGGGAV